MKASYYANAAEALMEKQQLEDAWDACGKLL
jgi:hypothetical protein